MSTTRNNRFSQKSRDSVLGGLIDHHITDGSNLMNALEFIEGPAGLNIKLYPVQRVIIKLIFGIPMDWEEREVPVYDMFCEELLYTFKETEYIRYVYEKGRINIPSWEDAHPLGYNEIDMIVGRRGGKALEVSELIPTPNGMVQIGALKAGDTVFSPTGKPVQVKYAHDPFNAKSYRVTFDDGSQVLAHGEHLWKTYTRAERKALGRNLDPTKAKRPHTCRGPIDGGVRTTKEIRDTLTLLRKDGKTETNHSIPVTQAVELPVADLPIDPYFLGLWLGDGTSSHPSVTTQDQEIADAVYKEAEIWGLVVRVDSNGSAAKTYHISSGRHDGPLATRNGLRTALQRLNLLQNKYIPHEYLWASAEQRLALLQGLMDTDGCCSRFRCEFNNTNEALARGVFHLAASLGLKPYWIEKRATLSGRDCGPCYRVSWTGTLPVFRLSYKLAKLPKTVRPAQTQRFITSVEECGEHRVRCITVDSKDGLFLFGNTFNTTHNSVIVAAVAAYKLYLLLNHPSPQDYYGLVPGSPIDLTMMAQDSEGSNRLYDQLKEDINRAPFFAPFVKSMTSEEMTFVAEADRLKRDITPSIKAASYPCLEENELVWTGRGLIPIKDIEIEDQVLDHTGSLQTVTAKIENEERLLSISTANFKGDPLLLTPQHTCIYVPYTDAMKLPYLARRERLTGATDTINSRAKSRHLGEEFDITLSECHASELRAGDYLLFPRIPESTRGTIPMDNSQAKLFHSNNADSRTITELPVNPTACRLYGLFLAEGSTSGGVFLNQVRWTFHINERETLAKFVQAALLSEFGLNSTISEDTKSNKCVVVCCGSELARGLARWFGRGSNNKNIPVVALFWMTECQTALIRGYYEGDECDNRDIAPTVSRKLAYSLFNLAIQAGLRPSVLYRKGYTDKTGLQHKESWYVELCKQDRHCRFFQPINGTIYYWSKVTKVVDTGRRSRVIDINVRDSHSFLTKLAAVHNCTTNAVRGPSSYFLALDEFAFYRQQIGSSSDEMYNAASPATMQFKAGGTREGKRESMIFIITSPANKIGKYYTLFKTAMEEGADSSVLAFQCSTAEMNPRSDTPFLKKQYKDNPEKFRAEYGGEFLDASGSFTPATVIDACIDTERNNIEILVPEMVGHKYFWGLDLGMKHDATALAICHWEGGQNNAWLVYDYIGRMMVGEAPYEHVTELPLDDVLAWLKHMNDLLGCYKGATDQYGGSLLVQLLTAHDIFGMELVHLTGGINSQMFLTLKSLMENQQIKFPNVPLFISELKLLEATYSNKYQIRVAAPDEKGAHDDMADAAALAAYVAQNWAINEGKREIGDIMLGIPQNVMPGIIRGGGWDMNASLSHLKSVERQLKMQLSPYGAVQNPWRKR